MTAPSMVQRWVDLFPEVSLDHCMHCFRQIQAHYDEPHRHYHVLLHIEHMLVGADRYFPRAGRELLVPIWLHDLIYIAGSPCNEFDSCCQGRELLTEMGLEPTYVDKLLLPIMDTADHVPTSETGARLCDLDLIPLGLPLEVYRNNTPKIRREYGAFDNSAWRTGRRSFCRQFLQRPSIYSTPMIRDKHESPARRNLTDELAALS